MAEVSPTLTGANRGIILTIVGENLRAVKEVVRTHKASAGRDGQLTPAHQSLTPHHPCRTFCRKTRCLQLIQEEVIFAGWLRPTAWLSHDSVADPELGTDITEVNQPPSSLIGFQVQPEHRRWRGCSSTCYAWDMTILSTRWKSRNHSHVLGSPF